MRRIFPIVMIAIIPIVLGCSKTTPTTSATALGFRPDFTIQWPGAHEESFLIMPGKTDEMKQFNASFTESKIDKETGKPLYDGTGFATL